MLSPLVIWGLRRYFLSLVLKFYFSVSQISFIREPCSRTLSAIQPVRRQCPPVGHGALAVVIAAKQHAFYRIRNPWVNYTRSSSGNHFRVKTPFRGQLARSRKTISGLVLERVTLFVSRACELSVSGAENGAGRKLGEREQSGEVSENDGA